MATRDDEAFLKRLRATFKLEAEEHLQTMSHLLMELEKAPLEMLPQLTETLFREAHSLKGAARSVNMDNVESICQVLEDVLAELKKRKAGIALPAMFFDVLNDAIDCIRHLVSSDAQNEGMNHLADIAKVSGQLKALCSTLLDTSAEPLLFPKQTVAVPDRVVESKFTAQPDPTHADTVRISTAKLGALLVQAEELRAFKFSAAHLVGELRELRKTVDSWKKEWEKMTRDARVLRRFTEKGNGADNVGKRGGSMEHLLETIEREEFFAKTLGNRLRQMERAAEQERRTLAGMVDTLLEDMKRALMLPFGTLLEAFPKMVRDISRENGKEAELVMTGYAIEIDRRILEQIKNPLIHLIRNAIDHGIELPHDRERAHKSRVGHIEINVLPREGNKVDVIITDDGAGINRDAVIASALRLGVVSPESSQRLGKQEILNLIFESGMSTSRILTDMSGRGLGLAIVREKVEKLGGTVFVDLPEGGGTRFHMTLPTSLATFRGLLVSVGDRQWLLPLHNVERVARISKELVKTIENRDTIEMSGQTLSLVNLSDALGWSVGKAAKQGQEDYLSVVVLVHAGRHIAFQVDDVLADQEVLVKSLGPQLVRVRNVSGAAVLGAGNVIPILNVQDLFKSALKTRSSARAAVEVQAARQASLLVAEDSITSRALLKNILETAGYNVTTAVDGIDALTTLRTGKFDLLVSDVEMPRMDGFDLTAKIRADKKFSELPVILVTALGSREHKERGIDVGANAYIVKRSFEQGNLLDAIRRLL